MTFRPQPKPEKKKKPKATGEKELFMEIWCEREHFCENCTKPIRDPNVSNFHHIKPKGKYPELRLVKSNIALLCFDCHFCWHNDVEQYNKRTKKEAKYLGEL